MDKVLFYCETSDSLIIESYVNALEAIHKDKIKILIKEEGLYFLDINTVFYRENFKNYICYQEIQLDIDFSSFFNALKTVDGSTVLCLFIKKNDIEKLRIVQRKENSIQRDIISIHHNKNLSKKRTRMLNL